MGEDGEGTLRGTAGLSGEECWVQGRTLELSGRLAEAVEVYREAVRRGPRNPLGLVRLGLALRGAGRDEEANQAFQQALDLSMAG